MIQIENAIVTGVGNIDRVGYSCSQVQGLSYSSMCTTLHDMAWDAVHQQSKFDKDGLIFEIQKVKCRYKQLIHICNQVNLLTVFIYCNRKHEKMLMGLGLLLGLPSLEV